MKSFVISLLTLAAVVLAACGITQQGGTDAGGRGGTAGSGGGGERHQRQRWRRGQRGDDRDGRGGAVVGKCRHERRSRRRSWLGEAQALAADGAEAAARAEAPGRAEVLGQRRKRRHGRECWHERRAGRRGRRAGGRGRRGRESGETGGRGGRWWKCRGNRRAWWFQGNERGRGCRRGSEWNGGGVLSGGGRLERWHGWRAARRRHFMRAGRRPVLPPDIAADAAGLGGHPCVRGAQRNGTTDNVCAAPYAQRGGPSTSHPAPRIRAKACFCLCG